MSFLNPAMLILGMLLIGSFSACDPDRRAVDPLIQEAYVWQRVWNEPVRDAIRERSAAFKSLVVLGAEVSWKQGQAHIARAGLDFGAVRLANCPIGVALRIGPFGGPFSSTDATAAMLSDLAAALLAECASNGVSVCELQIDFDCADSKLDGYRLWLEVIRQRIGATPLVLTTLPSWLNQSAFKTLISAADGYVLQVHSLDRPKAPEATFELCNPEMVRRAVLRAARYGKPFRVALPTYGYVVAFDRQKRFLGLSADGPELIWPEGAILRETRAEPDAMAALIRDWAKDRPSELAGVIWYRLPVAGETLNWSWPTLVAVMSGRVPNQSVRAEANYPRPGLVELTVINDGERNVTSLPAVEAQWQKARLIAADGIGGFRMEESRPGAAQFRSQSAPELKPGERRMIGWLRLDEQHPSVVLRTF